MERGVKPLLTIETVLQAVALLVALVELFLYLRDRK